MIAAIKSKFSTPITQRLASTFHALNAVAAPGIFNGGNPQLTNVTLIVILILTGVCVIGNVARARNFGNIASTNALS